MMRGKVWLGPLRIAILLGVLALSVMAAGSVFARSLGTAHRSAGSPNPQEYCMLYDQTLASKLHVSVAQLDAARVSALRTAIQKAYSDGAITQSQEQDLLSRANQLATNPCAVVGRMAAEHQAMGQVLAGAHQAVVTAVAASLNMPGATLESDLAAGQTVQMIAAAQHVSLDTVNAAYLGAIHSQLQTAVSNQKITQAQADAAYSAFQRAVNNGVYPLLRTHSAHK